MDVGGPDTPRLNEYPDGRWPEVGRDMAVALHRLLVFVMSQRPSGFQKVAPEARSRQVVEAVVSFDLVDVVDVDGSGVVALPRHGPVAAVVAALLLALDVFVVAKTMPGNPSSPATVLECEWVFWVLD